jgi:hypothetical protein
MPTAEKTREETEFYADMLAREKAEKEAQNSKKVFEELPNFILFINERIETAKRQGERCIKFNYRGRNYSYQKDSRCAYTFDGYPTSEHAEYIEHLYKSLGFYAEVRHVWYCHNGYRDGEVIIRW